MSTFDLIWGVASLLGLGVSVWTLLEARSAKKAAEEARKAVFQGSAADDLDALLRLAVDLLRTLYDGNTAEALVRLRDLSSDIPLVRHRWERVLGIQSRIRLDEAALQLRVVVRAVSEIQQPDMPKLITAGHTILSAIAEANGIVRSEIDDEVNDGK